MGKNYIYKKPLVVLHSPGHIADVPAPETLLVFSPDDIMPDIFSAMEYNL